MDKRCEACLYFEIVPQAERTNFKGRDLGLCHRYPPVRRRHEEIGPIRWIQEEPWRFPVVHRLDWCGEFRLKD